MNFMITYQKTNGEVFYRKRKSLMGLRIGETTSMGWLVVDVKYWFKNGYYSLREYQIKRDYYFKRKHLSRTLNQFFMKYATTILLFLILIYLIKF